MSNVLYVYYGSQSQCIGSIKSSDPLIRSKNSNISDCAGGIILFLIALKMVFPVTRSAHAVEEVQGEPLLVPLAIAISVQMLLEGISTYLSEF